MLKRNLIVIAILAFGLVMASNTFGQSTTSASGQATGKRKVRKPNTGFMDYANDEFAVKATKNKTARQANSGQSSGRRMKTLTRKSVTHKDSWDDRMGKSPVKQMQENNTTYQQRRKPSPPRTKRQHKP